jgi:hypothetical protein
MSSTYNIVITKKDFKKITKLRINLSPKLKVSHGRVRNVTTIKCSSLKRFEQTLIKIAEQVEIRNLSQVVNYLVMVSSVDLLKIFCQYQQQDDDYDEVYDEITMKHLTFAFTRHDTDVVSLVSFISEILIKRYTRIATKHINYYQVDGFTGFQQLKEIHNLIAYAGSNDKYIIPYQNFWIGVANNRSLLKSISYKYEELISRMICYNNYQIFNIYVNLLAESNIKILSNQFNRSNVRVRGIDLRPFVIQAILSNKLEYADILLDKFDCTVEHNGYNSDNYLDKALTYCREEPTIQSLQYFHKLYAEQQFVFHKLKRKDYRDSFIEKLLCYAEEHDYDSMLAYLINAFPHYSIHCEKIKKQCKHYLHDFID